MKQGPPGAEKLDRNCSPMAIFLRQFRWWVGWTERIRRTARARETGKMKGYKMKKISNTTKASTDDIYCVSAADVADKIIDHMRRGLVPLLFCSSSLAQVAAGPMMRTRLRRELD